MMAVNRAVEALADDPAPPGAFVRGAYCRLRVGSYRVLYEAEGDLITIVRIDRVQATAHQFEQLTDDPRFGQRSRGRSV
jgi:mRNA-degrading endonuclease RelE of RelBE toxin-antitoxin system